MTSDLCCHDKNTCKCQHKHFEKLLCATLENSFSCHLSLKVSAIIPSIPCKTSTAIHVSFPCQSKLQLTLFTRYDQCMHAGTKKMLNGAHSAGLLRRLPCKSRCSITSQAPMRGLTGFVCISLEFVQPMNLQLPTTRILYSQHVARHLSLRSSRILTYRSVVPRSDTVGRSAVQYSTCNSGKEHHAHICRHRIYI